MIKRYALFAGEFFYPAGGWRDFVASSDDLDELKEEGRAPDPGYDWWEIVDLKTMGIVAGTEPQAHRAPDIEGGEEC